MLTHYAIFGLLQDGNLVKIEHGVKKQNQKTVLHNAEKLLMKNTNFMIFCYTINIGDIMKQSNGQLFISKNLVG